MRTRLIRGLTLALAGLVTLFLLAALALALFGWNWARGPLQEQMLRHTGRALRIDGELKVVPAWPFARLAARGVSYANPAWATAPQLLQAQEVQASLDLRELLRGRVVVGEVLLVQARLYLEQSADAAGVLRKTWLLDPAQTDEAAQFVAGQVRLDTAEVSYTDAAQDTSVQATLSTAQAQPAPERPLVFQAGGRLRGRALQAQGSSGSAVLAWRDPGAPSVLQASARIGATEVQARGTVTSLLQLSAIDVQLVLIGQDMAELDALIGVSLPPTPAYRLQGRLNRIGERWRFGPFKGQVGQSDIAGALQLATGSTRPLLTGTLASRQLFLADLGPAIGAAPAGSGQTLSVWPSRPFVTAAAERWGGLDADVNFSALRVATSAVLPLDQLQVRVQLHDRQLTLDPLTAGVAGGELRAKLLLDGSTEPLRVRLGLQLRDVQLARLNLPGLQPGSMLARADAGRLDGMAELSGEGASVARLLASAEGRIGLIAQGGRISRQLMQHDGLRPLQVLSAGGRSEQVITVHCAVAELDVARGELLPRVLMLDSAESTVVGRGRVSLTDATWDLHFIARPKLASGEALRGPVYLRGPLHQPVLALHRSGVAASGLGALARGLVDPLLAVAPSFQPAPAGPGPCAQPVREALAPASPISAANSAAR